MRRASVDTRVAADILARVARHEKIETLIQRAASLLAAGKLDRPNGNNALESYEAVLAIDPEHAEALDGIRSVASRLVANAQTAAFSGDRDSAKHLIARARGIAPDLPGIAETQKLTERWHEMAAEESVTLSLRAAAQALARNQLIEPADDNALAHYKSVLELDPGSEAAQRGMQLVLERLVDRVWSFVRSEELERAMEALGDARSAGVRSVELNRVREELDYQVKLSDARNGRYSETRPISELQAVRQTAPSYPGDARGAGWVELGFTVSMDGNVVDATVLRSSSEEFERAGLEAIQRWRFEPYMENGRPLPVRSAVRFSFQDN